MAVQDSPNPSQSTSGDGVLVLAFRGQSVGKRMHEELLLGLFMDFFVFGCFRFDSLRMHLEGFWVVF